MIHSEARSESRVLPGCFAYHFHPCGLRPGSSLVDVAVQAQFIRASFGRAGRIARRVVLIAPVMMEDVRSRFSAIFFFRCRAKETIREQGEIAGVCSVRSDQPRVSGEGGMRSRYKDIVPSYRQVSGGESVGRNNLKDEGSCLGSLLLYFLLPVEGFTKSIRVSQRLPASQGSMNAWRHWSGSTGKWQGAIEMRFGAVPHRPLIITKEGVKLSEDRVELLLTIV